MQAHPRGFENGSSGVYNKPGIAGMISENNYSLQNPLEKGPKQRARNKTIRESILAI